MLTEKTRQPGAIMEGPVGKFGHVLALWALHGLVSHFVSHHQAVADAPRLSGEGMPRGGWTGSLLWYSCWGNKCGALQESKGITFHPGVSNPTPDDVVSAF